MKLKKAYKSALQLKSHQLKKKSASHPLTVLRCNFKITQTLLSQPPFFIRLIDLYWLHIYSMWTCKYSRYTYLQVSVRYTFRIVLINYNLWWCRTKLMAHSVEVLSPGLYRKEHSRGLNPILSLRIKASCYVSLLSYSVY